MLCGVRNQSKRELIKHTRIVHLVDNEYLCDACDRILDHQNVMWCTEAKRKRAYLTYLAPFYPKKADGKKRVFHNLEDIINLFNEPVAESRKECLTVDCLTDIFNDR